MSGIPLLDNPNLAMVEIAAQALGELCESLVFVGGCATGLLVTTVRAHDIRATEDVDVMTRVASVGAYHEVEARLAGRGFKHDISPDAPICRWVGSALPLILCRRTPVFSVSTIAGSRSPWKRRSRCDYRVVASSV